MDVITIVGFVIFIPISYGLWLPFFESYGKLGWEDKAMSLFLSLSGPMSVVSYGICLLLLGKNSPGFRLW